MTDPTRSALRAVTRSARLLSPLATIGLGLGLVLGPRSAEAAPGVSVGGQVGTQGAQGSASSSGRKAGYKWPERVVAGNAISLLLPVQVGFVGYLPRVRIGWENFRLDECGLDSATGVCNRGTVAGFDVYAGYAHKWFLRDRPWLVPIARDVKVSFDGAKVVAHDKAMASLAQAARLPDRQPRPRRRRECRPRPHALDRRAAGRAADQERQVPARDGAAAAGRRVSVLGLRRSRGG